MNDNNGAPVAEPPAFSAEYWSQAPRQLMPEVAVLSVRTVGDNKEYALANGARLIRPTVDIKQLIMVGTQVQVQVIPTGKGQIVTGLFLPQVKGWAWQMSAQDLADYAREVETAVVAERMKVRLAIVTHLKGAFIEVLNKYMEVDAVDPIAEELAVVGVIAMEEGPA